MWTRCKRTHLHTANLKPPQKHALTKACTVFLSHHVRYCTKVRRGPTKGGFLRHSCPTRGTEEQEIGSIIVRNPKRTLNLRSYLNPQKRHITLTKVDVPNVTHAMRQLEAEEPNEEMTCVQQCRQLPDGSRFASAQGSACIIAKIKDAT